MDDVSEVFRSRGIGELASRAFHEFNNVADYVWKAPRLIEHETKLELKKLDRYFPDRPDLAEQRWKMEEHKLASVFPFLIAVGNLYSVVSLFEVYLLLLQTLVNNGSAIPQDCQKKQGAARALCLLKSIGVAFESSTLNQPIQAAFKIRNCLVHAGGLLSQSRDEKELRRIVAQRTFLTDMHKSANANEVSIAQSTLGERLRITNAYSFLLVSYVRDFYLDICERTDNLVSIP